MNHLNADLIREMVARGATDQQIANALGITSNSASKRRRRLGLACNAASKQTMYSEWTQEETEKLRNLTALGYTDREIGEQLGRTAGSVSDRRRRIGLRSPRVFNRPTVKQKVWELPEVELMRRLFEAGKTETDIAAVLGRTRKAVKSALWRFSIFRPPVKEKVEARTDEIACQAHLLDLFRMFGGETLGDAKARYRERCEWTVTTGTPAAVNTTGFEGSACSSSAGWL